MENIDTNLNMFYCKPYTMDTTVNFRVNTSEECEKQSNILMYKTDEVTMPQCDVNSSKFSVDE